MKLFGKKNRASKKKILEMVNCLCSQARVNSLEIARISEIVLRNEACILGYFQDISDNLKLIKCYISKKTLEEDTKGALRSPEEKS